VLGVSGSRVTFGEWNILAVETLEILQGIRFASLCGIRLLNWRRQRSRRSGGGAGEAAEEKKERRLCFGGGDEENRKKMSSES